ncbi:MAG: GGDEF domain-containing protein, partial [Lysobacteraceae bacterium]
MLGGRRALMVVPDRAPGAGRSRPWQALAWVLRNPPPVLLFRIPSRPLHTDHPMTRTLSAVRHRRLSQEMVDTYQRALTGGYFYAAAWLVVALYGGAFGFATLASVALLVVFLALATQRFVHRPLADGNEATLERWMRTHWGIVLLTTALWGGLFCWVTLDARFGDARVTGLLFTLGLCTAVAHAFSMRRGFAFAGIGLLCVPGLAMMLADPDQRANAWMCAVYLVYVVISLLRSYHEYQQRLDLDQELRTQRDLFSRQSRIDPLTELANRRQFSDALESACTRTLAGGPPLSLLLLDIDHFKQINDTHGHALGDACLVAVAERLVRHFDGATDLPARVGGEEFAVVLPQDLASATHHAERFRQDLVSQPVVVDGRPMRLTASIGVATFDPARHPDMDALY